MNFFRKKPKPLAEPKPKPKPETGPTALDIDRPDSPLLIVQLVDNNHLEVAIEWPENCDVRHFAHVLSLLTSGHILSPLSAAAHQFGIRTGETDKAVSIQAIIEATIPKKRADKPVISPSKVMTNQMRIYGH